MRLSPTRRQLLTIITGLLVASTGPAAASNLRDVSPEAAHDALASNPSITVVDIRTPWEFSAGHIEGAVNIDFYNREFGRRFMTLDPGGTYLIYCEKGVRSRRLMNALGQTPFVDVMHLATGISGWRRAGLPVAR